MKVLIYLLLLVSIIACKPNTESEETNKQQNYFTEQNSNNNNGFITLELFSSESCYDCPSAEEALNKIVDKYNSEDKNVIALASHVDYWNDLIDGEGDCKGNWVDKYSTGYFTSRQFAYTQRLETRPATPQVFINGKSFVEDPSFEQMEEAIEKSFNTKPFYNVELKLNTNETEFNENKIAVDFKINISKDFKPEFRKNIAAQLQVYLVESEVVSKPDKGENCGEVLKHQNVARVYTAKTLKNTKDGTIVFDYPEDVVLENCTVVGLVQNLLNLEIVGGTNGFDIKKK